MLLKGAGVAFLATYAFLRHNSSDAKMLGFALLFGAAGDIGVELSFEVGGALFFFQHVLLIALFLKHGRDVLTSSQKLTALALLVATPLVGFLLTREWTVAIYCVALGGMAASAWASRFSRYRVGIGAVLFVVSDWLIFAQMGPLANSDIPGLLIWPIYFAGQFLICTGVIQTLRGDLPEAGAQAETA